MLWAKKNSYKEFDNEKKFLWLENPPPPPHITFLKVRPLVSDAGVFRGARHSSQHGRLSR